MKERDRIYEGLPKIDCGACGAPTCRAFAEDIVLKEAEESSCFFFWKRALTERVEALSDLVHSQGEHAGGRT
jgi:CO dehydrogenase/acetyl-CoA synthase gamma subunit (corrinoid Fe-S protein)